MLRPALWRMASDPGRAYLYKQPSPPRHKRTKSGGPQGNGLPPHPPHAVHLRSGNAPAPSSSTQPAGRGSTQ